MDSHFVQWAVGTLEATEGRWEVVSVEHTVSAPYLCQALLPVSTQQLLSSTDEGSEARRNEVTAQGHSGGRKALGPAADLPVE